MDVAGHAIVFVSFVGGLLHRDVLGAGRRPLLVSLHGLGPCVERPGQSFRSGLEGRVLGGSAAALCAGSVLGSVPGSAALIHLLQPRFIDEALLLSRGALAPVEQLRR